MEYVWRIYGVSMEYLMTKSRGFAHFLAKQNRFATSGKTTVCKYAHPFFLVFIVFLAYFLVFINIFCIFALNLHY